MAPQGNIQKRGKPRGIRRDRDCLSCKARNVKCDLNRPRCLPCVQAGLICQGYPQRVIWMGQETVNNTRLLSLDEAQEDVPEMHMSVLHRTSPQRTYGLDVGNIPPVSLSDDSRHSFLLRLLSFCQQILSKPGDDEPLVSRLSEFVEARLKCLPVPAGSCEAGYEPVSVARNRLAALMELNEALRRTTPFAILGIATFAVLEVIDGTFGDWQRHLYGAKSLLDCYCRNRADLDELSAVVIGLDEVIARLTWFDTMGAVVRGDTALIFNDWHRQLLLDGGFLDVVGCSPDTFEMFISIAKGEASRNMLTVCFQAMDELLKLSPPGSCDLSRVMDLNRCAAVIALVGRVRDEATASIRRSVFLSAVEYICRLISTAPLSSFFITHTAVPVYLAGMGATTSQHCGTIRAYWKLCVAAGVPRSADAMERCEVQWREMGLEWLHQQGQSEL